MAGNRIAPVTLTFPPATCVMRESEHIQLFLALYLAVGFSIHDGDKFFNPIIFYIVLFHNLLDECRNMRYNGFCKVIKFRAYISKADKSYEIYADGY